MIHLICDSEICELLLIEISSFSSISHDTSVSLGHDEPPIKLKYIANEQQTKTYGIIAGLLGGKPTATAAFTYGNIECATTEAAEDVVCPKSRMWNIPVVLNSLPSLRHVGWSRTKMRMKTGTLPSGATVHWL
jgi:hypothetical protein